MNRTVAGIVGVISSFGLSASAMAQGSFAGTGIQPGQTIRVTVAGTGERIKGEVEAVTLDRLRVNGRDFAPQSVTRVERVGDSLWNGVIVGALAGAAWSLVPSEACLDKSRAHCFAVGAESGALVGLVIDSMHDTYTTVYPQVTVTRRVYVAPRWGRRVGGVVFGLRF